MSLTLETPPVPLVKHDEGTIRIAGTRIPLERIIHAWQSGETPEQIAEDFPTLKLADVYACISYYLNNKAEVEAYMHVREHEQTRVRADMEKIFPSNHTRARLLARRAKLNDMSD